MTEQQVNEFLIKTRETVESLETQGRHELAQKVLATGSVVAQLCLSVLRLPNYKVFCPSCHIQQKTGLEKALKYTFLLDGEEKTLTSLSTRLYQAFKKAKIAEGDTVKITRHGLGRDTDYEIEKV